ncbi:GGDEF domain-containing protein [Desulfurobacterium crinifex]
METKYKILQNLLKEVTRRYDYLFEMKERLLKELAFQAMHDFQTGLYNYKAVFELGEREIKKLKRGENKNLWVVFIDLDNFKQVNDNFGHRKGDEILKEFASFLKESFRDYDIIGRLGGDEFIIVLTNIDSNTLKRRLLSFKEEVREKFKKFDISTSIGVSCSPYDGDDFDRLVTIADSRMYEAKKSGKDKISW